MRAHPPNLPSHPIPFTAPAHTPPRQHTARVHSPIRPPGRLNGLGSSANRCPSGEAPMAPPPQRRSKPDAPMSPPPTRRLKPEAPVFPPPKKPQNGRRQGLLPQRGPQSRRRPGVVLQRAGKRRARHKFLLPSARKPLGNPRCAPRRRPHAVLHPRSVPAGASMPVAATRNSPPDPTCGSP